MQMSLCNIFAMQAILYQMSLHERDSDAPAHAENLVSNSGNALWGV